MCQTWILFLGEGSVPQAVSRWDLLWRDCFCRAGSRFQRKKVEWSMTKAVKIEVISLGDELVRGDVLDTNSAQISLAIETLGLAVWRHSVVGDRVSDIAWLLRSAVGRSREIICTGGLGPTLDDCTVDAVGRAFQLPAQEDPQALGQVARRYAAMGRELDPSGRRQARLPRGAGLLPNPGGTAPGFTLRRGAARLWFLPGVPREMQAMLELHVLPGLRANYELTPPLVVTLHCIGMSESVVQERMRVLSSPGLRIGYRAVLPEIQVRFAFEPGAEKEHVASLVERARSLLGRAVFAVEHSDGPKGDSTIAAVVGRTLLEKGQTVACAESCTAGRVAAAITSVPGSSGWFTEGAVVYSNQAKSRACGVPGRLFVEHGAVSEAVATTLAQAIRRRAGTDWGISTTGIAGPTGGTPEKPVGTVYVAVAGPGGTTSRLLRLPGDREMVMALATGSVLDLLRRRLEQA